MLRRAGIKPAAVEILFDGADIPIGQMEDFQRSIPVKKALHPDTLLAYMMNGEKLPAKHGFPLRCVVPGWAGNSWMKWVTGVRVLTEESRGFWMKNAYLYPKKTVPPGTAVPAEEMNPVTNLRVKSIIAFPGDGSWHEVGKRIEMSGAAWSGDAGPVAAVDVSVDSGRSWKSARLTGESTRYGWRLWQFPWTPLDERHYTILARARDAGGEVQPLVEEWNPSGYLWNAAARAGVQVAKNPQRATPVEDPADPQSPASFMACRVCHETDVIFQQRLTRAQWDRELSKMINWGARPMSGEDRQALLDFLVKIAGPR